MINDNLFTDACIAVEYNKLLETLSEASKKRIQWRIRKREKSRELRGKVRLKQKAFGAFWKGWLEEQEKQINLGKAENLK